MMKTKNSVRTLRIFSPLSKPWVSLFSWWNENDKCEGEKIFPLPFWLIYFSYYNGYHEIWFHYHQHYLHIHHLYHHDVDHHHEHNWIQLIVFSFSKSKTIHVFFCKLLFSRFKCGYWLNLTNQYIANNKKKRLLINNETNWLNLILMLIKILFCFNWMIYFFLSLYLNLPTITSKCIDEC